MRKFLTALVAVLAIGATTLAISSPASAQWRGGWGGGAAGAGAPVHFWAVHCLVARSPPDWPRRTITATALTIRTDRITAMAAGAYGTAITG